VAVQKNRVLLTKLFSRCTVWPCQYEYFLGVRAMSGGNSCGLCVDFMLPSPPRHIMFFANMDSNYWGLWCVPLGLVICFAPALIATVFTKPGSPIKNEQKVE